MTEPYGVTIDPAAIAVGRTPLALNTGAFTIGGTSSGTSIDWGEAAITAYEANEQRWGAGVIDYRVPNRTVTVPLLIDGAEDSAAFRAAKATLTQKVGLLQAEGGWLERRTADGVGMYLDVVNASLTVPDVWGEAADLEPNVVLVLECLPDFFGDEVTLDTITASGECVSVLQQSGVAAVIAGDYPGRAAITILDTSGNAQHGVLWGFRSRHYGGSLLAFRAATTLTPASGASVTSETGARSGNAIAETVGTTYTELLSGTFTSVGSYQVWARLHASVTGASARWDWGIGDLSNPVTGPEVPVPGAGTYLVNLGQIRVPMAAIGAQQWEGELLLAAGSGTVDVWCDMLYLVPLDESAGQLADTASPVVEASSETVARYDGVLRQLAGGSAYAPAPCFGDLPRIPFSGVEGRPVQLLVKPSRGDLSSSQDAASADGFQVSVSYRPCFMFRP